MIIKTQDGQLINTDHVIMYAVHQKRFTEKKEGIYCVYITTPIWEFGHDYKDTGGSQDTAIYTGTKDECDKYLENLHSELETDQLTTKDVYETLRRIEGWLKNSLYYEMNGELPENL